DRVSGLSENGLSKLPQQRLVLGKKNGSGSVLAGFCCHGLMYRNHFLFNPGQRHPKGGAPSQFTVDFDVTVALLDNAIYGGQAEPGSLSDFFGGEKRLKDASAGCCVH